MSRRKPKPHRTGGSARHPNSLANLKPFSDRAPIGNSIALKHGYRSEALVRDVQAEVRELMDALAESAPVRDPDGGLPAADTVAIETAARALKRWRSVSAYCDTYGRIDPATHEVRPAARFELEGERALHRCLDVLGMTPQSRSRLGLNIARSASFDLARHWAEHPLDSAGGDGDD